MNFSDPLQRFDALLDEYAYTLEHGVDALPRLAPIGLAEVSGRLGLDAAEASLLWLVAAPELSVRDFHVYRRLWPDGPWPPLEAACELAGSMAGVAPEPLIRRVRCRRGPLGELGVLRVADVAGAEGTAVSVASDVIAALAGDPPSQERGWVVGPHSASPWETSEQSRLDAALHALSAGPDRLLLLEGGLGLGVAPAMATQGIVVRVDLRRGPEELQQALTSALRHACLLDGRLLVEWYGDDAQRDALRRWLRVAPRAVAVACPRGGAAELELGGRARVLSVRPPSVELRRLALERVVDVDNARRLAARHPVGLAIIAQAARTIGDGADATRLEAVLDHHRPPMLRSLGERYRTTLTFDDAVLASPVLAQVQEIIRFAQHRTQVFDDWGMQRLAPYGAGLGCLFAGPPGTGKTMLAGLVAEAIGVDLYRVDVSRIVSKWVGETDKNLARLFVEAERANVALFFDEADSLFARRTEVQTSNDRHTNTTVNVLLERMERFEGLSVLATNLAPSLDPAVKRRLRFVVHLDEPTADERAELWCRALPPSAPTADRVDFPLLGRRLRLSGGLIKNAVIRAAVRAAATGSPLTTELLLAAGRDEQTAQGRLG